MINYTRSSMTLNQGDIYSITTGKITRNPGRIIESMIDGLKINDPEALAMTFKIMANQGLINRPSKIELEWIKAEIHPHA